MNVIVFFFQAEDGIRDRLVTGVQTCALPIYAYSYNEIRTPVVERSELFQRTIGENTDIVAKEM